MGEEKRLTVREIAAAEAAAALGGLHLLDPAGVMTPESVEQLARRGRCFKIEGTSQAVYVLRMRGDVVWVDAAMGQGKDDVTALLDEAITGQSGGCRAIAMQTARPGLVKKLKRHGWKVTGWVMRKEMQ